MRRWVALLALLLAAGPALAANKFVRAGAGGSATGADWTNAYTALPATLTRGDTYYIADGSYSGYTFDDAASNTSVITVKKCTTTDGVSSAAAGYSSAYCDGQVVFTGGLNFTRPYYVIDGAYRGSSWSDSTGYGFRLQSGIRSSRLDGGHDPSGECSGDNLTFRYIAIGATSSGASNAIDDGLYLGGFGAEATACQSWTLEYSAVFNTIIPVQCAGCKDITIQYTHFGESWGKEAIRGQHQAASMTIRFNEFVDSCQKDPADGTSGCTAEIALWGMTGTGYYDNNKIYGNVFYKTATRNEHNSGGVIVVGGNGSTWLGSAANDTLIYNNTTVGIASGVAGILVNGGTGNICRNNLWYDVVGTGSASCNTVSNNVEATSDPFVAYSSSSWASSDLRLGGATDAGYTLSSPYNVDLLGTTRGSDGTWDLGAYEYGSGSKLPGPGNPRWRPADAWHEWFAFWSR